MALLQNGVPSSVVAWETPVKLPSSLSPRITKFQPTQWGQQNLWFLNFIPLDGHLNMTIHTVCISFWIPKRQTIVSRKGLSLGYSEQDTSSVNSNHSKCLAGSPSNWIILPVRFPASMEWPRQVLTGRGICQSKIVSLAVQSVLQALMFTLTINFQISSTSLMKIMDLLFTRHQLWPSKKWSCVMIKSRGTVPEFFRSTHRNNFDLIPAILKKWFDPTVQC